jgi:hypothetical protein
MNEIERYLSISLKYVTQEFKEIEGNLNGTMIVNQIDIP